MLLADQLVKRPRSHPHRERRLGGRHAGVLWRSSRCRRAGPRRSISGGEEIARRRRAGRGTAAVRCWRRPGPRCACWATRRPARRSTRTLMKDFPAGGEECAGEVGRTPRDVGNRSGARGRFAAAITGWMEGTVMGGRVVPIGRPAGNDSGRVGRGCSGTAGWGCGQQGGGAGASCWCTAPTSERGRRYAESSARGGRLRLGGMALRNGLLIHGPTSWAAAARTPDGRIEVASGPKPVFRRGDLGPCRCCAGR